MAVMPHEGTHTIIFGTIPVPVGSAQYDGYLARPDQGEPARSVIVLHDAEGITPEVKDLCRLLARRGWVALAPDWFHGMGSSGPSDDGRAIAVIDEAVEFLAADDLPYADAQRPAVVGVGSGGRIALLYADHNRSASAVVTVEPTLDDAVSGAVASIGAPVLGFFGAEDVEVESVDALQAATANGQWIVYEGVGAGFLDAGSDGFHAGAERDALARTVRVLSAALA